MRFDVLGPLEVVGYDDVLLSIGGPKKRAALGYLLLHANEVVATSQLVEALWPGDAPSTARKMVQNTVSDIRAMLAEHDRDDCFALLTHSPGYLLRAAEHRIDLLEFQQLARSGRQALATGSWTEASDLLGRACRLWRGDALVDLTDAGVDWPELAALREDRLTTLEDYFEAELAAGRHYDHLTELDRLVSAQPHRERACRQLMLALYRCGRQVEALDTYQRTRMVLAAKFGIEPTPELRETEQAILRQDTALAPPTRQIPPVQSRRPADPVVVAQQSDAGEPIVERKLVAILTVAFELGVADRKETDEILAELDAAVRADLSSAGALVLRSTGSSVQAVFGVPRTDEQDALTAVRTALAIRDRFAGDPLRVRLVVSTAEARVKLTHAGPEVISPAFEDCLRLLWPLPPGRVWVCGETRLGTGHNVVYTHNPPSALWCAWDIRPDEPMSDDRCGQRFVDRDHELAILREHFDQVARHGRGRSAAVLGQAGMGKTRLVAEFVRTVRMRHDQVQVVATRIPHRGSMSTAEVIGELVVACCPSLSRSGSATTAEAELATGLASLVGEGNLAESLTHRLLPLLRRHERASSAEENLSRAPDALVDLITAAAIRRPLILVIEDLHRAEDDLLRLFEALAEQLRSVPLLMISTARPQLFDRGHCRVPASTTMMLDRLSDEAVRTLWASVLGDADAAPTPELTERISGNPLFAVEFARQRKHDPSPARPDTLPPRVYRAIAAELDELPAAAKQILTSAAPAPDRIEPDALASALRRNVEEVRDDLDDLVRRHLLRHTTDRTGYEFTGPLVRDVAHSQLPASARPGREPDLATPGVGECAARPRSGRRTAEQ
jgi:DNA-binding SARP family transcriptional activator